jgi:hypothetical protein
MQRGEKGRGAKDGLGVPRGEEEEGSPVTHTLTQGGGVGGQQRRTTGGGGGRSGDVV